MIGKKNCFWCDFMKIVQFDMTDIYLGDVNQVLINGILFDRNTLQSPLRQNIKVSVKTIEGKLFYENEK